MLLNESSGAQDDSRPLISLVVPVFNEAARICDNLRTILDAASGEGWCLELVAVDDGSSDETPAALLRAANADPRIHPIAFTRNFGKEAAIHAGLQHARGDAVIVIDADLQHPPTLIPRMIELWQGGVPVVEAVKLERQPESRIARLLSESFYRIFGLCSGMDLRNQSDFKLLSREVVETYLCLPERQRFFRGLIHWTGFASAQLPFEVTRLAERPSRWGGFKLVRYALTNITAFSSLPLHFITGLGVLTLALGLIVAAISLYQKVFGHALDGFTTVNLLLVIIGGALMIALGIIGHYLSAIYEEVKGRPRYVLKRPAEKDQ